MKNFEELAYCGMFCGSCKNYKKGANCLGCRNEDKLLSDCPTRVCTFEKGLIHCGECFEFPCKILKEFYEDGIPHHSTAYQNILRIKEIGIENWFSEQKKK